ncbi:MAG TPA: sigma-70 family RNA polymerase sigma factor [Methylomirabilota bacterium]|jgi:RNA polymerase sigma-70 factor (ECF subfamily)|nr:sigma-70 family RNA polymerase sigma factor [Methylomirabilota bacterium]
MTSDDHLLLTNAAGGDASALETLMSRYSGRVYRLAYGITRSQGDAEEVVQDVFLQMVLKGTGFEGRAALGTWIYRVTTNLSLNKCRGKRRELETSLEDYLPTYRADGHREGERALLVRDWSNTPEQELLSGEARRILNDAIDRLPEHYRAVLILKDVEELSNDEVAEVVGDSVAAVKTRLHRARMALREQLTRQLGAGA